MATQPSTAEVIASALNLPYADRLAIVEALEESLIDDSIDHGPSEPADEVEAAWSAEIARRIADIDSGKVKTISSEEFWSAVRGRRRTDD